MEKFILIFLCFSFVFSEANIDNFYHIEIAPSMEIFRFEDVGELFIIHRTVSHSFSYDFQEMWTKNRNHFDDGVKKLERYVNETNFNFLNIEKALDNKKNMYDNIEQRLKDLMNPGSEKDKSRRKRNIFEKTFWDSLLDFSSNQDEKVINQNFQNQKNLNYDLIRAIYNLSMKSHVSEQNLKELHNFTAVSSKDILAVIEVTRLIENLDKVSNSFDEKVEAVWEVMVHKRLNMKFFNVNEFHSMIKNITLEKDEQIPFNSSAREFYTQIEVNHSFDHEINLILTINIPIIRNYSCKKLKKIEKYPVHVNESDFITINTQWNYLASDNSSVSFFLNLDSCYKKRSISPTYFCELQSPILHSESQNCLARTVFERKINVTLCHHEIKKITYKSLTFIRKSDSKFFFFAPNNETIEVYNRGSIIKVTLPKFGEIELRNGSFAVAKNHATLETTIRSHLETKNMTGSIILEHETIEMIILNTLAPLQQSIEMNLDSKEYETNGNFEYITASITSVIFIIFLVIICFIIHVIRKLKYNIEKHQKFVPVGSQASINSV